MKKLIIVKPGCRDFGNELINHMSIYAYSLEVGAQVVNRSPFLYSWPFRVLHALYARCIGRVHGRCSLRAWRAPIFLPPTKPLQKSETCDTLYFFGWVFRNPKGLVKYRNELVKSFAPAPIIQHKNRIGIHLRLAPFSGFPGGDFLVPPTRVREILDEYVHEKKLDPKEIELFIISDLPLAEKIFAGYTYTMALGNTKTTLFALATSSVVIGTNTTFSNTAAWFGNVPHIVTTEEPIDWVYYRDKVEYFDNRYATFAF